MTKNENITAGRAAGEAEFNRLNAITPAYAVKESAETYVDARVLASNHAAQVKNRSSVFFDAFVEGYAAAWRSAHYALPEVKQRLREEAFTHKLDSDEKQARERLAKFKASLDDDPLYAFQWADSSIEAAATLQVVARLRAVIATENVEAAISRATEEAIRMARSSSRSTSTCSNLVEDAVRAAYARFAEVAR